MLSNWDWRFYALETGLGLDRHPEGSRRWASGFVCPDALTSLEQVEPGVHVPRKVRVPRQQHLGQVGLEPDSGTASVVPPRSAPSA